MSECHWLKILLKGIMKVFKTKGSQIRSFLMRVLGSLNVNQKSMLVDKI